MSSLPFTSLVLLGFLTAIGPLAIDMYLPAFPALEAALGADPGDSAWTLASFFIGMALGQLVYGPVSDRLGRRPPLLFGLLLFSLASLGCAIAASPASLAAWRFLQALGGCAGVVIGRAVVRDRCASREAARAFSLLILVFGLAPILAPLLGAGLLLAFGWRSIFLALALYGAVCVWAVWRLLPETHANPPDSPLRLGRVLADYAGLFASRSFLGATLVSSLAFAGMFAYIAGSPFVIIQVYGIAPEHFGWLFGANALGFVIASQVNARRLRTSPLSRLLRRAVRVPALAGLVLASSAAIGWLPLPLLLTGFFAYVASLGFIGPNATAAALATHGQRAGTASALMGALQFALATLVGVLLGVWHDGSAVPLMGIIGVCGIGAWLAHRWLVAPLSGGATGAACRG